jgi:hypothetical protein
MGDPFEGPDFEEEQIASFQGADGSLAVRLPNVHLVNLGSRLDKGIPIWISQSHVSGFRTHDPSFFLSRRLTAVRRAP